ncbi:Adapter molecule Crk [Halotydeus destructor]|nr:Adapter molecule Crk [Halotydeus destructor]
MANFDPYDKDSWFFGPLTRAEANAILMTEPETGSFLVRNSGTCQGDLVLCVKEDNKVSHYIINKVQQGDQTRFRIGDQMFPDIPALLLFYKRHYLDTTHLMRPAAKLLEKVRAKYDFQGSGDSDDLLFVKGELLTIISKDEDQWWTARNALGQVGSIPVPYVERMEEENGHGRDDSWRIGSGDGSPLIEVEATLSPPLPPSQPIANNKSEPTKYTTPSIQRKIPTLPALARVVQARVPNAYDKTALKLQVGDVITVTQMNINGQWEGELNGKVGHFPFTHVDFIESDNNTEDQAA